jgi:hypothetical protein
MDDAPMPGPLIMESTVPENLTLDERQTAFTVEHIAKLTDVDPFIIESCGFKAPELAAIFQRAHDYHNDIIGLHHQLGAIETENKQRFPGESSRDVTLKSPAADALKITAKLDHLERRMQAMRESLYMRARLKAGLA